MASKSDTVSNEKDKSIKINNNEFKKVMEKSEKLKKSYYNRKTEYQSPDLLPSLDVGTWITGVTDAEVIDIEVDRHDDIKITARILDNNNIQEITVRNRDDIYSDQNEIVRLLEYMDIREGEIPELLGKEIPVKVTRYALPSNELRSNTWKPYVPKKFDQIGILKHKIDYVFRYLGYEGEFQSKIIGLSFIVVALYWWGILTYLFTSGLFEISYISSPLNIIIFITGIISILFTIYTPFILRCGNVLKERYNQSKREDTIIKE